MNDIVRFVRIARDLCRGLNCLHDNRLVHRDIKLENCGLDHQERAKIFDLGLVTSDPQDIRGNIFTRAPELFTDDGFLTKLRPKFSSDVWALGATLYALRFGEYPFVHRSEIDERNQINERVRDGALSAAVATERKNAIRDVVGKRIGRAGAFDWLSSRIANEIGGSAADILVSMLSFSEDARPSALVFAEKWGNLARDLGGSVAEVSTSPNKWIDIGQNLNSVLRKEMTITRKQIERLATEIRESKKRASESQKLEIKLIEALITKIKSSRANVGQLMPHR